MLNKNIFIFFSFVIFFLSLSSVSAWERTINDTDIIYDVVSEINTYEYDFVINLNPGVYNKIHNKSTDLNSAIRINDSNIIIQGNGDPNKVVIDANGNYSWIFTFAGSNNHITFKNITFKGVSHGGGAVHISGPNNYITVEGCSFLNNKGLLGSAITTRGESSTLIVNNSQFINNSDIPSGDKGHAILFDGRLCQIINSNFVNNSIFSEGPAFSVMGGAINSVGLLIVNNSTFINNSATANFDSSDYPLYRYSSSYGGAIYCDNGLIFNSIFINNSAFSNSSYPYLPGSYGGAIYCGNGLISNSTFINNVIGTIDNVSVNKGLSGSAIYSWGNNISLLNNYFINQLGIVLYFSGTGDSVINQGNVFLESINSSIVLSNSSVFSGVSVNVSGVLRDIVSDLPIDNVFIRISFNDVNYTTITGSDGSWSVILPTLSLEGENNISLETGSLDYPLFINSSSLTVIVDVEPPRINNSLNNGSYFGDLLIVLNISEEGSVYYTLDGSTPTNQSRLYIGPFILDKSAILRYIAYDLAGNPSEVYSVKYDINKMNSPKVPSVKEGSYKNDVKVSLTGVDDSEIYYKLGNSPYNLYTGFLTIKTSTTLSYYYQDSNGAKSLVKSVKYVIDKTAPKSLEKNVKKYKKVKAKKQTLKIKFSENIKINSKNLKKILVKNNKGKKIKVKISVKGKYLLVKVPKIVKKTKYTINIPKNIVNDSLGNLLKSKVVLRYLSK